MEVDLFGVLLQLRLEEINSFLYVSAREWLGVCKQNMICLPKLWAQSVFKRHYNTIRYFPDPYLSLHALPFLICH